MISEIAVPVIAVYPVKISVFTVFKIAAVNGNRAADVSKDNEGGDKQYSADNPLRTASFLLHGVSSF